MQSLGDDFFEAYNEGREDEARMQGITYGVWSAIMDDAACDFCRYANDRSFLVVESHQMPPAHFGCRCLIAYFTAEMIEEEGGDVEALFLPWEDPPVSTFPPGSKK
jgi:hypothetical protein